MFDLVPSFLAVFAIDDAIYAALISAAIGTAAQAATTPDQESKSTALGNVPKMDQPEDPWSWFRGMMSNGGGGGGQKPMNTGGL